MFGGNHGGDHKQVNGEPGGTAGQRGHENGDQAVFGVVDCAGGHDPRHGAGIGTEQRKKGFAAEADFAHQTIHNEGQPGHVAGVLHQSDEEEENKNLRKKDDDVADAGDDAFLD